MVTQRSRPVVLTLVLLLLQAFATLPLISAQEGTLNWGEITSSALADNLIGDPKTRSFAVYLPPSYRSSQERYPVFYVLHGYTQRAPSLTSITPTIDSKIRRREIGEMIAVFVDGSNRLHGSWYLNSKTIGDYETYIVKELVDHIDATYRTIADRESRGITGFSMGGYGAMHLALKYPEVFGTVVSQAGPYDMDSDWWRDGAKGTAVADLRDWSSFGMQSFQVRSALAYSAGVSPNPAKPPLFLDKPFELVDGQPQIVPDVWRRHVEADIVHGHLDRYLRQPVRLTGIMLVHGTGDNQIPVSQARTLDKAMADRGIIHTYEEHAGGHTFIADKSLKFLSAHLVRR